MESRAYSDRAARWYEDIPASEKELAVASRDSVEEDKDLSEQV
jgi:hypothetical protein